MKNIIDELYDLHLSHPNDTNNEYAYCRVSTKNKTSGDR